MQESEVDISTWIEKWDELDKWPFSKDHLHLAAKIASLLSLAHNYNQLNAFICNVQRIYKETSIWKNEFLTNEVFMLALIDSELYKKQFQEVYHLIGIGAFSDVESIVDVWYRAHYKEQEMITNKKMTAVRRHRIRAKYPPPSNLRCPTTSLRLPKASVEILKHWLAANYTRIPTSGDVEHLVVNTELTKVQVKNWLSNNRRTATRGSQRVKPRFLKPDSPSKIPNAGLSGALFSDVVNPENHESESPSKYLNLDIWMSSSSQNGIQPSEHAEQGALPKAPLSNDDVVAPTQENLQTNLKFMDKTFLGYVPAYCTKNSDHSKPTVVLDVCSIQEKIKFADFEINLVLPTKEAISNEALEYQQM